MYQRTSNPDLIKRVCDGTIIPRGHYLWALCDAWLAEGNSLLPIETDEELSIRVRGERDSLLAADVDTINAVRWAAMSGAHQAAWTAYRQALLDVPEQPGFPASITWPVAPQ